MTVNVGTVGRIHRILDASPSSPGRFFQWSGVALDRRTPTRHRAAENLQAYRLLGINTGALKT